MIGAALAWWNVRGKADVHGPGACDVNGEGPAPGSQLMEAQPRAGATQSGGEFLYLH